MADILRRGDPGYDDARAIWNAMIDRRPALIACCAAPSDIVEAVNIARERGLPVAVRGGGHGVAGHAVCDGGVMIDLSRMRAVDVDAAARRARIQGGATWGDFDRATGPFGLATPGGIVSTTGVGGLTLGGGFGWLSRKHGLAADNLRSVDIVTATGEMLTASADQNTDLFWGVRGGSGNFGVVASFEFDLHPVGDEVLFGPTFYRLDDAEAVLRHYREFVADAPNECTVYLDFFTAPPVPFLPAGVHGTKLVALIQCYVGDLAQGEKLLKPLREYGRPVADLVAPRPYAVAQSLSDAVYEKGMRNYWNAHYLTALPDGALSALTACTRKLPTPQSDIFIQQLGGAINQVAPDATAYVHRDAAFIASPGARWQDPSQDDDNVAWVRACHQALSPYGTGRAYVNFIAEPDGRARDAYGANLERLSVVKRKYDPGNLFRLNQNVRPVATT
jgi:FAD/FMN-containing dehydrogenase